MKKKRIIIASALTVLFVALPPMLAPIVHTGSSSTSAIRHFIHKKGFPYQSFLALIQFRENDPEFGERYYVNWINWDSETGATENFFYVKKNETGTYEVESIGTAP